MACVSKWEVSVLFERRVLCLPHSDKMSPSAMALEAMSYPFRGGDAYVHG
jgi:hypothetical protein